MEVRFFFWLVGKKAGLERRPLGAAYISRFLGGCSFHQRSFFWVPFGIMLTSQNTRGFLVRKAEVAGALGECLSGRRVDGTMAEREEFPTLQAMQSKSKQIFKAKT